MWYARRIIFSINYFYFISYLAAGGLVISDNQDYLQKAKRSYKRLSIYNGRICFTHRKYLKLKQQSTYSAEIRQMGLVYL